MRSTRAVWEGTISPAMYHVHFRWTRRVKGNKGLGYPARWLPTGPFDANSREEAPVSGKMESARLSRQYWDRAEWGTWLEVDKRGSVLTFWTPTSPSTMDTPTVASALRAFPDLCSVGQTRMSLPPVLCFSPRRRDTDLLSF